jgi:hypothetical protein
MNEEFQRSSRSLAKGHMSNVSLSRGIGVGVIGSWVGTIIMDLVMVLQYSMMGQPALTSI